jgi:hypothetical protein
MSNTMQRMGILTGGGDCPGLNAVIRAAVKTAINEYRWEVLGIEDGFEGLIKPNARGERRATRHRHPHMGKKPVVWPIRSTAWFGPVLGKEPVRWSGAS